MLNIQKKKFALVYVYIIFICSNSYLNIFVVLNYLDGRITLKFVHRKIFEYFT